MRRTGLIFGVAVLMVFISAGFASAATHEDMVARYVKVSGADRTLESIPELFEALAKERLETSKTPEFDRKIVERLKQAFDAECAKKDLAAFVSQKMDDGLLKALLQWYETPLAQKIVAEEFLYAGPDQQPNLLRYLAGLKEKPPAPERISLIQKVEETTQISELLTNRDVELIEGMGNTINLSLPKEKQVDIASIKVEPNIKTKMKEEFREQLILTLFYTYRNLTDQEIKEYMLFYLTDAGKKEIEILGNAFSYVFKQWFAAATDLILSDVKNQLEK